MPARGRRLAALSVILPLAIATAGCATEVRGTPQAASATGSGGSGGASEPGGGAGKGLGATFVERMTIGPCSVIGKSVIAKYGKETKAFVFPQSLDICALGIDVLEGQSDPKLSIGVVDVELDTGEVFVSEKYLKPSRFEGSLEQKSVDGATVYSGNDPKEGCLRAVAFADKSAVKLTVKQRNSTSRADNCAIADDIAESVRTSVAGKKFTNRQLAPNSLALVDLCQLVDPALVGEALGGARPKLAGPNLRDCTWGDENIGPGAASLTVGPALMDQQDKPTPISQPTDPVAGRTTSRTLLDLGGGLPANCTLTVAHIGYPFVPGKVEALRVGLIGGAGGGEASCAKVRKLTESLVAKLPPV